MYSKDKSSSEYPKKVKTSQCVVNLDKHNNSSYQILFKIDRKNKTISFGSNELEANRVFKELCHDLDTGKLSKADLKDLTGDQIKSKLYPIQRDSVKLTLIETIKTESNSTDNRSILEIWEQYKLIAKDKLAKSTYITRVKTYDAIFSQLSDFDLLLINVNNLGKVLLNKYTLNSVYKHLVVIQSMLNVVLNNKPIGCKKALPNDYKLTETLPKIQKNKTTKKFYKPDGIKAILDAFESQYYYPYILFCAYTGCRPSEAIALRVSDIKISGDKVQVLINKAFSKGCLNNHTKNYKTRLIPVASKLASFLIKYVNGKSGNQLLFPGVNGGYLDHHNFTNRHYKPIIKSLVKQGLVNEYLSPYHLRHSYATNLLRQGKDIADIAGLIGDLISTVIEHYIGSDYENTDIPDIY